MIETYEQLLSAVEEIQERTGWTHHRIANKAGVNAGTLYKLVRGEYQNPHEPTLEAIDALLKKVRRNHKNAEAN